MQMLNILCQKINLIKVSLFVKYNLHTEKEKKKKKSKDQKNVTFRSLNDTKEDKIRK